MYKINVTSEFPLSYVALPDMQAILVFDGTSWRAPHPPGPEHNIKPNKVAT